MKRALLATAALAVVTTTGAVLDVNRPPLALRLAADAGADCVVPDCRTILGRGAWDPQHEPVDCLAGVPYSGGGAPVWRGCTVFRAEYAVGSRCLPSRCEVTAGENPLEEIH